MHTSIHIAQINTNKTKQGNKSAHKATVVSNGVFCVDKYHKMLKFTQTEHNVKGFGGGV
jgi:hypothetical protein